MRRDLYIINMLLLGALPISFFSAFSNNYAEIKDILLHIIIFSLIFVAILYLPVAVMSKVVLKNTTFSSDLIFTVYPVVFYVLYLSIHKLMLWGFDYSESPPYQFYIADKGRTVTINPSLLWDIANIFLFIVIHLVVFIGLSYISNKFSNKSLHKYVKSK